jgi:hypothetical protein
MINRLGQSVIALIKALDILACTIWLAPLYVLGLADKPTGRRMVSSYIGKAAANGHRWARIAAAVIDYGAVTLGDAPEHCGRAYRHYRGLDQ